jgi:hypothetical protein
LPVRIFSSFSLAGADWATGHQGIRATGNSGEKGNRKKLFFCFFLFFFVLFSSGFEPEHAL